MENDYATTNNYKGRISEEDIREMTDNVNEHCEPIFTQRRIDSQKIRLQGFRF